ncbi:HAD-superfamily hydrolase, subfamily IIA [Methylobacterium sp. 4-46]|uniref:TIGR01459 family HAD-type hydrolase n=1 Tax=unclassified Methylobacterium TaxID=2615210 RepID=UPI000152DBDD|nr:MULTISPECIES: TIGR01459 family HAD-type hydrolase [Methylobacterium]ACA16686.1 HAD-superfamily hydrolase, subfamily IIA [Methylobacterium sp. 4-46]WFT82386.1 TIGR01459 family HAD-type hydrolase [Methylobacterium nodulans]
MATRTPRPAPREVPVIDGIAELASGFDVILCDVWGVLHDGLRAHRSASEALSRFRALPGERPRRVVLVSNAPRPGEAVRAQLDGFGVPREAYDGIVTSGDLTRALIEARPGAPLYHLGPERDLPIFEGLSVRRAPPEEAAQVVCTGLFDDEVETAEDYRPVLAGLSARGLPMICANPDLVVERGARLIPCAGALAGLYEALGGEVIYAGKPHRPVYEAALAKAAAVDGAAPAAPERVLAVGDAIRTDIAGASGFGIASVLVARGIHAEELGCHAGEPVGEIAHWLEGQPVHPDAVIDLLRW